MHRYGVGCEGVHDAEDEEELEKDGEPGYADISDCQKRDVSMNGGVRERKLVLWAVAIACDMNAMNQASCQRGW